MAKSSVGISLLLLPFGSVAAQAPLTADLAIAAQKRQLEATLDLDCRGNAELDEIVVCGREGRDPNRIPLPDERVAGARTRLLPGEPPPGSGALAATAQSPCSTVGPNQRCSGGLDVLRVVGVLAKAVKALTSDDD